MRDENNVDRQRQEIERADGLALQYLGGPGAVANGDTAPEGIVVTLVHTPLNMVRAGLGENRAVYLPIQDGQTGIVRIQQTGEPLWSVVLGALIVELFATAYPSHIELSVVIRREEPPAQAQVARAA